MSRKTNQGSQSGATQVIGLDIGYGVTKAVAADTTLMFPSVWGAAREIKFKAEEIAAKYPGDQLSDDEGDFFVGDLALSQLPAALQRRYRGRTANEQTLGNVARLRLAKAALGKLYPGRRNGDVLHLIISTGLPVDHMRGAAELKQALIGQHRIQTDRTDFIANVADVKVMPQPYGTIYRSMLTAQGAINPCHKYTRTGVIDVGTYTIDAALDDDGEYIDAASGSIEAGVYTAHEAIAIAYEREFQQKPDLRSLDEIMRKGCLRYRGEMVDFSDVVEQALTPVRSATLELATDKWQAGASVDVIYVSGGGAPLVFEGMRAAYPQAQLVENAQLANAQGYYNYALFDLTNP